MNVYFLFPSCWTSLPFDVPSVLVVRGGAVCLPHHHLGSPTTGVFDHRFESLFPHTGVLGWAVWFTPLVPPSLSMSECGATGSARHHLVGSASCSLACPISQSITSLGPSDSAKQRVLSARLPVSAPPPVLDECFFFISLVGLPCSSIFCQLWLFFVFKLLLSFFWLCEEAT